MIYLNTAGTGKISAQSAEIAKRYLDELVASGSIAAVEWRSELDLPTRQLVAQLMDADVSQVALVPNTSYGLTAVAQRLSGERKRVLTIEGDYPSITLPWKLLGFDWISFEAEDDVISVEGILKAIEQHHIEIIVISHVMWHTGYKVDIEAICSYCKTNGIISIVDSTQSLGTIPISFRQLGADVMLSSCYKWLYAGFGLGLMAMSDWFFQAYPPQIGGFASFQDVEGEWVFKQSMKSYQPGSLSISSMAILKNAIEELLASGINQIHAVSIERAEQLVQVLSKFPVTMLGKPEGSSLSNLVCIEAVDGLSHYLEQQNVIVVERNQHIRFSVSHETTIEELVQLEKILSSFPAFK